MAYSLPFSAAAAAGTSINVNPVTGDDSLCGVSPSGASCRSIARAVQLNIPGTASYLNLSAGIYNETTISISNVSSLVISGVPNATVFDCRGRQGATSGAAFAIINSTVAIVGLTFEARSNPTSNGGAVSASGSSVVLSQCSFTGCSAASGGAVSVTGPGSGSGLFLSVQNSLFTNNSASGSLEHCPANTAQPCSTWGGAVAAFEMYNVSISGCTMVANRAAAVAPPDSTSSLAGGGCLSVLFRGNASGAAVHVSSNRFLQCIVDVGAFGQGNGYGGAISVYFGLTAGLQLLSVSFFNLVLRSNVLEKCGANVTTESGNVYGGGVSLYIGAYSSVLSSTDNAEAAAGATAVRNVSVTVDSTQFTSCRAIRSRQFGDSMSVNAYGGAFSFYVGAYAWSRVTASSKNSASTCAATTASGLSVSVSDAPCISCRAETSVGSWASYGASAYGGSMSAMHVGAYAWSRSLDGSSSSTCAATIASDLSVVVRNASCSDCGAKTVAVTEGQGANAYGGSLSAMYVGASALSMSGRSGVATSSASRCEVTAVSGLSLSVSDAPCISCRAETSVSSGSGAYGANAYGGSMSAMHVGAYAWAWNVASNSSSVCAATTAGDLSVVVRNSPCSDCSAVAATIDVSRSTNSYGGSLSALYVGAYAFSRSEGTGVSPNSASTCAATTASGLSVSVSDAPCISCRAETSVGSRASYGASAYGGSMSAMHVGAYAWSFGLGFSGSSSLCEATLASQLRLKILNAPCYNCFAEVAVRGDSNAANAYGGSISAIYVRTESKFYQSQ